MVVRCCCWLAIGGVGGGRYRIVGLVLFVPVLWSWRGANDGGDDNGRVLKVMEAVVPWLWWLCLW